MEKVEFKDTKTIQFQTQEFSYSTQEWVPVAPDNYAAKLETLEMNPTEICDLDVVQQAASVFWVKFYANSTVDDLIQPGKGYYVAFYWDKDGENKCERHPVVVVPNV